MQTPLLGEGSTVFDGYQVRKLFITACRSSQGQRKEAAWGPDPHPNPFLEDFNKLILDALLLKEQWNLAVGGKDGQQGKFCIGSSGSTILAKWQSPFYQPPLFSLMGNELLPMPIAQHLARQYKR